MSANRRTARSGGARPTGSACDSSNQVLGRLCRTAPVRGDDTDGIGPSYISALRPSHHSPGRADDPIVRRPSLWLLFFHLQQPVPSLCNRRVDILSLGLATIDLLGRVMPVRPPRKLNDVQGHAPVVAVIANSDPNPPLRAG